MTAATVAPERRHLRIGVIGLVVLAAGVGLGVRAADLPLVGAGARYHVELAETGGLEVGDPVLIAGVRVGRVSDLRLEDGHIDAEIRLREAAVRVTRDARAEVRVRTVLGAMALAVVPSEHGRALPHGGTIPLARTTTPLQLVDAVSGVAERSAAVDTDQLAAALSTLADLTRTTPEAFRAALEGVAGLAATVSSRDERLRSLLQHLDTTSAVLADRGADVVALMRDTTTLTTALLRRREAIHRVLVATSELSRELTDLIRTSRADLTPALDHLASVLAVLRKNEDDLEEAVRLGARFARNFSAVTGNGPWLDGYVANLPPVP